MREGPFLARIRETLGDHATTPGRAEAVAARLAHPVHHPLPSCAEVGPEDREAQLVACLKSHGVDVISIESANDIPEAVGRFFTSLGRSGRLLVSADDRFATLAWSTAPHISAEPWTGELIRDGEAALTHAFGAVAETGTLVLASGPQNPATMVFLPELHLVALARASIVSAFEDAFADVRRATAGGRLPRALNLVTAPSRTGDIGGRIVLGAHGPRRLAVLIYGPQS